MMLIVHTLFVIVFDFLLNKDPMQHTAHDIYVGMYMYMYMYFLISTTKIFVFTFQFTHLIVGG